MASGKELDRSLMDRIAKLSAVFGRDEISAALDVPEATVAKVVAVLKIAKSGDIKRLTDSSYSNNIKEWAAETCGLQLIKPPKQKEAEPAPAQDDKNLLALVDAVNRLNGNMVNLQHTIETVGEMLKSCINANADIINNELMSHRDILNGIKMNTRRRGGND